MWKQLNVRQRPRFPRAAWPPCLLTEITTAPQSLHSSARRPPQRVLAGFAMGPHHLAPGLRAHLLPRARSWRVPDALHHSQHHWLLHAAAQHLCCPPPARSARLLGRVPPQGLRRPPAPPGPSELTRVARHLECSGLALAPAPSSGPSPSRRAGCWSCTPCSCSTRTSSRSPLASERPCIHAPHRNAGTSACMCVCVCVSLSSCRPRCPLHRQCSAVPCRASVCVSMFCAPSFCLRVAPVTLSTRPSSPPCVLATSSPLPQPTDAPEAAHHSTRRAPAPPATPALHGARCSQPASLGPLSSSGRSRP